jgi:hypothetical protein
MWEEANQSAKASRLAVVVATVRTCFCTSAIGQGDHYTGDDRLFVDIQPTRALIDPLHRFLLALCF